MRKAHRGAAILALVLFISQSTSAYCQNSPFQFNPAAGMQAYTGNWRQDSTKANDSQAQFEAYRAQVGDYVRQVEQRCAEAHMQRMQVESQYQRLQKQMAGMTGESRGEATRQLANMKDWLASESTMDAQAARNIEICERWLHHQKDQANIDAYNAAEDQQMIADQQQRMREQQQLIANEQRKAADRAYWQGRNEDQDYYGGGGYWPHNRGYGHNYAHYWHSGGHSSGGHSSGGHSSHISYGGHGGGHGGHR